MRLKKNDSRKKQNLSAYYLRNKSNMLASKLERLQKIIYETLESCKSKYYENISKKLYSKVITPKYYWSLLKAMLNDKKIPCTRQFFTLTNLLQILVKKPISLLIFLQNSPQLLKITVFSPHQLIPLPISTWQTLNSRRMILKE